MAKKILFIEDESALQRAVTQVLKKTGYEILQATDGEAGLKLALSELPDLILLDLILPKKDGFDVLKDLKKDQRAKNIPVIILTNLERALDVEKALELGATTYLVKTSYRLEEVAEKIKQLLGE